MKNPKTVLITGASSGIGLELAKLYAKSGVTLMLTGRDGERLEQAATACRAKGAAVKTTTIPVTDREAFEKQIAAWDDETPVELVIANAGVSGGHGKIGDETEKKLRDIMATNVDGMFNTVNPLIDRMRQRKKGHIALMSSIAGFRGLPTAPAYSTSKNAVRAYGEALRPLLAKDNVEVCNVHPGFVRTPLTDKNDFEMPFIMGPERAARIIKKGIEQNRAVMAFPWQMRWFMRLATLLPRCWSDALLVNALRKKK